MKLKKLYTACWAIIIIVSFLTSASACDCVGKASVAMAYNAADVVLEGKVLSKTIVLSKHQVLPNSMEGTEAHYVFEVKTFFKGKGYKKKVVVVTGLTEGTCGYIFEPGKRYIVYTNNYRGKTRHQKYLSTNLCTRNCQSNPEELEQLLIIKSKK